MNTSQFCHANFATLISIGSPNLHDTKFASVHDSSTTTLLCIKDWCGVCSGEMYVTHHKGKLIKTRQPLPSRKLPIIDFQDEIVEMYFASEGAVEGVEKRRRWFIGRAFKSWLGKNQTPSVMAKLRQNINSAFYMRYSCAYVIVNVKTNLKIVYYIQQKGSLWIIKFPKAEKWINNQDSNRLNIDNIQWPNTK